MKEITNNPIIDKLTTSECFLKLDAHYKDHLLDWELFDIMWRNYPTDIPIPSIFSYEDSMMEISWENEFLPTILIESRYDPEIRFYSSIDEEGTSYNMLLKADWKMLFNEVREAYKNSSL